MFSLKVSYFFKDAALCLALTSVTASIVGVCVCVCVRVCVSFPVCFSICTEHHEVDTPGSFSMSHVFFSFSTEISFFFLSFNFSLKQMTLT